VTACNAPSTSLYFTTAGDVLACCQSTLTPLGNITRQTLDEIWHGEAARAMRRALAEHRLPPACRFCQWQLDDGNPDEVYARNFDRFGPVEDEPAWPRQLELSLSNRCNLQCVMCSGDFSSTIRTRREARPPMPTVYGDEFFEQLRPYLRHLEAARFFGGEPFLVPEYQRIWDLVIEDGGSVACDVTTNGTVWSRRIADTLDALPFTIAVSLDGMTAETFEAIRVGADLATVLANIQRFAAYCADRGTPFALTWCLMVPNWREFPDFLAFAGELGADAFVNTVTWPNHLSLYDLPPAELSAIADELERRGEDVVPGHPLLAQEVARLRHRADPATPTPWFEQWSPVPVTIGGRSTGADARAAALRAERAVDTLVTDADDRVVDAGRDFLGTEGAALVGRTYRDALRAPAARFGPLVLVSDEAVFDDGAERFLLYDGPQGPTRVHAVTVTREGAGATTYAAVVDRFPALDPTG
jgi:radical SAM protein with 4Fe4S-binding SPASM domain